MPFFKDYNKDVKDLLTKNFADDGWKIESKAKGPDGVVFVNPNATPKGINVDVQYNIGAIKTTTNVNDKGAIKPKVTFEDKLPSGTAVKIEATTDKDLKFEVTSELKHGVVSINEKLTNTAWESFISAAVIPALSLGAGFSASFGNGKGFAIGDWSAGAHVSQNGIVANVTTKALKTYTTGALVPIALGGKTYKIAAQVNCGGPLSWMAGLEFGCPIVKGATARVRVAPDGQYAVTYIKKFTDNWKTGISALYNPKGFSYGFVFTRE